jgi:predicted TIM-barrel fold metal-dependent hydrolase
MTTQARSTDLVDVHAHFLTDSYVAAARAAGHVRPDGMPAWPSWSAADHLRLMDGWGVGRSMLSISSPGVHFGDDAAAVRLAREVNKAGAVAAREHPDRFGHFASLPLPDVDAALAEAAFALDELGSEGVTVETNAHGRYLADPAFDPLWSELDVRNAVVFVHPTSPVCAEQISLGRPRPMLEFIFDTTRAVSDLVLSGTLERHPNIEWIFTHGGGTLPVLVDRIELFRGLAGAEGPDALEQIGRLWFDIAGTPFPRQVPAFAAAFGTERLLYGSDYCWTPTPLVDAQVDSVDAAWRDLTTRNAERLFTRPARRRAGPTPREPA